MRIKSFSSMVGKIVMAIVFASMIGGISIAPAFGRDGDDRRGYKRKVGTSTAGMSTGTTSVDGTYLVPTTTPTCLCATTGRLCPGPVAGHQPRLPHPYSVGNPLRRPLSAQGLGTLRQSRSPLLTCGWVIYSHAGDKQKRGEKMKRIIMLTMVLVMMLVSLGGCFWGYEGRRH